MEFPMAIAQTGSSAPTEGSSPSKEDGVTLVTGEFTFFEVRVVPGGLILAEAAEAVLIAE